MKKDNSAGDGRGGIRSLPRLVDIGYASVVAPDEPQKYMLLNIEKLKKQQPGNILSVYLDTSGGLKRTEDGYCIVPGCTRKQLKLLVQAVETDEYHGTKAVGIDEFADRYRLIPLRQAIYVHCTYGAYGTRDMYTNPIVIKTEMTNSDTPMLIAYVRGVPNLLGTDKNYRVLFNMIAVAPGTEFDMPMCDRIYTNGASHQVKIGVCVYDASHVMRVVFEKTNFVVRASPTAVDQIQFIIPNPLVLPSNLLA